MLIRRLHHPETKDRWVLSMRQVLDPQVLQPDLPPVLVVPGYGMNNSILAHHPSGPSMEECFAMAGFEIWSVNLRGQGDSFCMDKPGAHGLSELAEIDLPLALQTVQQKTFSRAKSVYGIGCSLGATIYYLHLASPNPEPITGLVSIGGPMRWAEVHPLLKRLFVWPRLAGFIPVRGTRRTVRMLLPLLLKTPKLLSLYLHPDLIDTSDIDRLVQSVDDPSPKMNREIAEWIHQGELKAHGKILSEAVRERRLPLLAIAGNADGIVPPASVFSAYETSGSLHSRKILVGDATRSFAHADLFVSYYSQDLVFRPAAEFLRGIATLPQAGALQPQSQ